MVNILPGWTFLGWIGALVWAIVDKTPEEQKQINNYANQPHSETKNKCRHCGFESYEKNTFCPVCLKDEKGLTMENYKDNFSKSGQS